MIQFTHLYISLCLVSLLFVILLIFTGLGLSNGDDMDSSDDDDDNDTGLMRLRRQLKKFAYADPCEVGCVTNKLHSKVPIKVVAVSYLLFNYDFKILYIFYIEKM